MNDKQITIKTNSNLISTKDKHNKFPVNKVNNNSKIKMKIKIKTINFTQHSNWTT